MAGDAKKLQPIVIKRVKKGGHGHHGGAWKIAYADFVTAMMAFFLLMWLLGSTSEGDKKGLADYFATPLKIALLNGGSGAGDASHVVKGGGQDLTRSTGQVKRGDIESKRKTVNLQALKAEQHRAEKARLERLKAKVEDKINANPKLAAMLVMYGAKPSVVIWGMTVRRARRSCTKALHVASSRLPTRHAMTSLDAASSAVKV